MKTIWLGSFPKFEMQVNSYFIPYFSATPLVHQFSEKVNKQIEN